jgi:RNA:NAD 2'-phosphotransferase (TPT1/KptA family)
MSLKTGNSRRVAKSRPVCMGLKTQPKTKKFTSDKNGWRF